METVVKATVAIELVTIATGATGLVLVTMERVSFRVRKWLPWKGCYEFSSHERIPPLYQVTFITLEFHITPELEPSYYRNIFTEPEAL